ncbi:type II toxin-antitoxin system Phd/YefM family antitoxin [Duganella sp. FT80W]|uniref:Type II toxin-antitoxin system Phd/YefM family antitoxin n=1 Tax=Duganella guangzhouensis TaxID=2666084 RepID=A0A6I2KU82_9BURK|nr:type II toxin-antitoxin system Phd/YefM family antitoxin [Duganella guangzhouensis]MRW89525.1 type II toxin-antitoxin system Phd/YefM family antitoxin [Duganella guangzhouensis]
MPSASLPSRTTEPTLAEIQEEANDGPVYLSGEYGLTHVLMTIADYERILKGKLNIVELLWMPGTPDIDFVPPRSTEPLTPADFS